MVMILLPWPDKRLSPNARGHWRKMQPAIVAAREIGKLQTLNAINGRRHVREDLAGDDPIALTITFYPPDRRHRDDDNMIAAFKSLRDGMASALKVNDKRFRPTYEFAEPVKGGKIEVRLL